jgi:Arc/MetJ family transcription regulator
MSRTNVVLDDNKVNRAMHLSGAKTIRETIDIALDEYISAHKGKSIFDLAGKVEFFDGYDYKSMRDGGHVPD